MGGSCDNRHSRTCRVVLSVRIPRAAARWTGRLSAFLALFLSCLLSHGESPGQLPVPRTPPAWSASPAGFLESKARRLPAGEEALRIMDVDLAATIAWSEDVAAPRAVLWVLRNSAAGEVLREVLRPGRWHTSRARLRPAPAWVRHLAAEVLHGHGSDPTGGARYFHRVGSWEPPWAPPVAERVRLGGHWFYRGPKKVGETKDLTGGAYRQTGSPPIS